MRHRRCGGWSLVEVLVGAALLGTAALAAAASVLESSEHQRANARMRAVTPILASLLDEARGSPLNEVEARFDGATRTLTGVPQASNAIARFTVTDIPTGSSRWFVKRVTVRISWDGASGPVSMSGATLLADWEVKKINTDGTVESGNPPEDPTTGDDGSGIVTDGGPSDGGGDTGDTGPGNGNGNANGWPKRR